MIASGKQCWSERTARKLLSTIKTRTVRGRNYNGSALILLVDFHNPLPRALFQISDILESNGAPIHDAEWRELNPFVFRSGSCKYQ